MYTELLLPDLRQMLDENDTQSMAEFCEALYPAVASEVLEELDVPDIWRVLHNCGLEKQVEIIQYFDLPLQFELVQDLDRNRLSSLVEEMSPDDRADLLARMPERVEELLPLIAHAERADIRKLLSYPEGSAGAIMTTDYASLPADITVGEALDRLRLQAPNRETIYYIYILDEGRHLRGMLSLRELILAKPDTLVSEIASPEVISVRVDDDQEFVAQELAKYDFIAIPVVDNQQRLVGIVTHDDALDIVQEEAHEDALLQAAVQPLEDSYLATPLHKLAWSRAGWLIVLMGAALITAAVLDHYVQNTPDAFKWMIAFLPLVLASGGNAGSQSATLVIRTMAVSELDPREKSSIIRREVLMAMMLGGGLSLLVLLFGFGAFRLSWTQALVVTTTVFLVVSMGTVSGTLLPLFFKRLGMDPALMSNPLLAALVDVCGVVIYYSVALWALSETLE